MSSAAKFAVRPDAAIPSAVNNNPTAKATLSPGRLPMGAATSGANQITSSVGGVYCARVSEAPAEVRPHRRKEESVGKPHARNKSNPFVAASVRVSR